MSQTVEWDPHVPPVLRRVLQDLVEQVDPDEGDGPLGTLARLLDVPTPPIWGHDVVLWIREQIEELDARRVYDFIEALGAGNSSNDKRVSDGLAATEIDLEMIDGIFYRHDQAAEELDVHDVLQAPAPLLHGRFAPARQQWEDSRQALTDRKYELAFSQAVNALESVVRIVAGAKSISEGLRKLFPTGERRPLADAINQLHNYGSAMPAVRHGSPKLSNLTAAEARGVCRAVAVWIVMLIDLDDQDAFPLA